MEDCCQKKQSKGFFKGILFGILPHSFCIGFLVFTVIGSTFATTFFRKFLLTPYFFQILIGLSFVFATISAVIYLKRLEALSLEGIKKKKGYLSILYGTTIAVNFLFFFVIFPVLANVYPVNKKQQIVAQTRDFATATFQVNVPCSGHAPLIIDELKKDPGIESVNFVFPNLFEVSYDSQTTNVGKILQIEIFKIYPAVVK